jgi:methylglutaconyl-CoA hydratase
LRDLLFQNSRALVHERIHQTLDDFRRIVVKVGSALLVDAEAGRVKEAWLDSLVDDIAGLPIDEELLEETARLIADRRASEEGQEGVRAFLDKRKPGWAE